MLCCNSFIFHSVFLSCSSCRCWIIQWTVQVCEQGQGVVPEFSIWHETFWPSKWEVDVLDLWFGYIFIYNSVICCCQYWASCMTYINLSYVTRKTSDSWSHVVDDIIASVSSKQNDQKLYVTVTCISTMRSCHWHFHREKLLTTTFSCVMHLYEGLRVLWDEC